MITCLCGIPYPTRSIFFNYQTIQDDLGRDVNLAGWLAGWLVLKSRATNLCVGFVRWMCPCLIWWQGNVSKRGLGLIFVVGAGNNTSDTVISKSKVGWSQLRAACRKSLYLQAKGVNIPKIVCMCPPTYCVYCLLMQLWFNTYISPARPPPLSGCHGTNTLHFANKSASIYPRGIQSDSRERIQAQATPFMIQSIVIYTFM